MTRKLLAKRKTTIASLILVAALLMVLLSSCATNVKTEQDSGSNVKTEQDSGSDVKTEQDSGSEDFAGQKIGCVTGSLHEDIARQHYPMAELCSYNNYADLAEALNQGKIDAYMLDEPVGHKLTQIYPNQSFSDVIEPTSYAYAFAKNNERSDQLREQMDSFIEECRENGVLQEIKDIWLGADETRKTVNLDGLTGENGTVHFAASTDAGDPFIYFKEDKLIGYEIDIMVRFCTEYGYDLEMTNYSFASLMSAIASGKADVAAGTITITEERKQTVNFSLSSYDGGVSVMTKKASEEKTLEESAGKKLGVVTGTMYEDIARRLYPEEELCFYDNTADLAKALNQGEIDAYMVDEPVGRLVVKPYPDQHVSEIIEPASFAFAFPKDSEFGSVLREQLNTFIEESRQNGVLQEIEDIWFGDDESKKTVSFDQLTGENGMIRLAISSDIGDPFVYFKNGGLVGYEPDLLVRFCKEYGYDLSITSYNFSSLFSALSEGLNDIAACAITVTPEREELVDFSLPTYDSGVVIVEKEKTPKYTLEDFSGKKIGIFTGSIFDTMLKEYIPDAVPEYINGYSDLATALETGKIDAYIADEPVTRLLHNQYPDQVVALQLEEAAYAFMFPKGSEKHQKLCDQLNEFLAQSRKDGTIAEIDAIWFGNDEERQDIDLSDLTGENGVLEMAVTTEVGAPFAYIKNGQIVGYDIDIAARFCRAYGYGLHISDYNPSGALAATSVGKADMAASTIAVTPERQETSLMSDPDYLGGIVMVTRSNEDEEEKVSFWTSLCESFERTFLRENRWKLFLGGLGVTFMIAVISLILGSLGGFAIYLIIRRGNKIFNGIWSFFSSLMGRTPVVVILMILYYIIFGHSDLSNTWISIIGFTLLFTCTVAELLKMGAGAVDNGQVEAALAMGYSEHQTYFRIVFPQSIEHFLPAYKSEVITLVKATAIVGYIAVQDLTKVSDLVRSRTYEAFFPLIATAIIYALFTLVLTWIIRRIDIMIDPRRRSIKEILREVETK